MLYIIACGAPPASQLPGFVRHAQDQGWEVCVVATPDGMKFLDEGNLAGLTGHPVRNRYKRPDEPDILPAPDAVIVVPATFNTINKWVQGISDTLALGLLNEAVGRHLPIAAVPWPNTALATHPVFLRSVATLRDWGVRVILDLGRLPQPSSAPPGSAPAPARSPSRSPGARRAPSCPVSAQNPEPANLTPRAPRTDGREPVQEIVASSGRPCRFPGRHTLMAGSRNKRDELDLC